MLRRAVLSIVAACAILAGCGGSPSSPSGNTDAPLEQRFDPGLVNNLTQDPDNPSIDAVYPEFKVGLTKLTSEERARVEAIWVIWPDGRRSDLERDFRSDSNSRFVKHELGLPGTVAPSGRYVYHVRLTGASDLLVNLDFVQRVLERPADVSIARTGSDLAVSWTPAPRQHIWSVQIWPDTSAGGSALVNGASSVETPPGSGRQQYTFRSPPLRRGRGTGWRS